MASSQYYCITRRGKEGDIVYFDYERITNGYDIKPRNKFNYDGIKVNKLIIIKQSFVEKLLRKKIKKKIELFLQSVIDLIDSDEEPDDGEMSEVLNELNRYKDVLQYKYQKYLNDEYIALMVKKINLIEYELKLKLMSIKSKVNEEVIARGRGR